MDLYTLAVVVHVVGAVLGVGTVTVNDLQFWRAIGDRDLGVAFQKSAAFYSRIIQGGLALLVASGFYFMFSRPVFWNSEKILTKLGLAVVLILNGAVINFVLHPKFKAIKANDWENKSPALRSLVFSRVPFDTISIATWYAVLFLGAVGRQPWNVGQIVIGYIAALLIIFLIVRSVAMSRFKNNLKSRV